MESGNFNYVCVVSIFVSRVCVLIPMRKIFVYLFYKFRVNTFIGHTIVAPFAIRGGLGRLVKK